MKRFILLLSVALLVITLGCSGTILNESWKSPEYSGKLESIYIIGVSKKDSTRRIFEDAFNNNFAKSGVPVLYAEGGYDHAEKGKEYALEFKNNYVAKNYHAPSDEYVEGEWDIEGMVQDAQIYFNIGNKLANSRQWPKWYPESEFRRPDKKLID